MFILTTFITFFFIYNDALDHFSFINIFRIFQSTVTYDERAKELGRGGLLNMFVARELKSRQAISDDELALGFTEHTDGKSFSKKSFLNYLTFNATTRTIYALVQNGNNTLFT